jgi:hypothetical protein
MRFLPSRSAAVALALAAMLLRALLPDGWMPSGHAGGAFFTICSVEHSHRDGKTQQGDQHAHAPCAFAAASTLAPPAITALAFGISARAVTITTSFTDDRATSSSPHRFNAARAPPAFA